MQLISFALIFSWNLDKLDLPLGWNLAQLDHIWPFWFQAKGDKAGPIPCQPYHSSQNVMWNKLKENKQEEIMK